MRSYREQPAEAAPEYCNSTVTKSGGRRGAVRLSYNAMKTADSGLLRFRTHVRHETSPPSAPRARRESETRLRRRADPHGTLAMLARAGDRIALGQLLEALAPRLRSAARALYGGDHSDVDDVVQEALLAVAKALPAFQGRSTVLHYAYRIAVRVCLHERRRQMRRDHRVQLHETPELLVNEPASTENVIDSLRRGVLRRLLDDLPDEQAETMALRVCLGMSLAEVAQATSVPSNTVRSRMRLARNALRRRIERDPEARELLGGWL